jgi:hypothetical protein
MACSAAAGSPSASRAIASSRKASTSQSDQCTGAEPSRTGAGLLDDAARSLLEIMAVSAGGWTIEAAAQVAALQEDRAIELSEALARHCLIQLVREACNHVLPVGPAAGLALLGDVSKVPGRGAMFRFLDRVGDIFDLGNASALWGWVRYCCLFPKCAWRVPR